MLLKTFQFMGPTIFKWMFAIVCPERMTTTFLARSTVSSGSEIHNDSAQQSCCIPYLLNHTCTDVKVNTIQKPNASPLVEQSYILRPPLIKAETFPCHYRLAKQRSNEVSLSYFGEGIGKASQGI